MHKSIVFYSLLYCTSCIPMVQYIQKRNIYLKYTNWTLMLCHSLDSLLFFMFQLSISLQNRQDHLLLVLCQVAQVNHDDCRKRFWITETVRRPRLFWDQSSDTADQISSVWVQNRHHSITELKQRPEDWECIGFCPHVRVWITWKIRKELQNKTHKGCGSNKQLNINKKLPYTRRHVILFPSIRLMKLEVMGFWKSQLILISQTKK